MSGLQFTCDDCGRRFNRREHLTRHLRIHSQEKPFTCSACGKHYARRDVYHRHLRTHGSSVDSLLPTRQIALPACEICHNRKVKCHPSERPCPRCTKAGLNCTVPQRRASSSDNLLGSPTPGSASPSTTELDLNLVVQTDETHGIESDTLPESIPNQDNTAFQGNLQVPDETIQTSAWPAASAMFDMQQFSQLDYVETDPNMMLFGTDTSQPTSEMHDIFLDDFALVYGSISADADLSSWTDYLDSQLQAAEVSNKSDLGGNHQQRLAAAYSRLHEYSTASYPSRPSSPRSTKAHEQYMQNLGKSESPICDIVIINVFIGLFQVHVTPTFPCFRNFCIGVNTPEEFYLAVAAVGGLYCNSPKSETVAKWLLSTARQKLLTTVHSKNPKSQLQHLSVLKTYILMEIFAFVCGDKRILLLLDVYHGQTIQAFRAFDFEKLEPAMSPKDQRKLVGCHPFVYGYNHLAKSLKVYSLTNAVELLESYRVVLLQRPTMLYPYPILDCLSITQRATGSNGATFTHDAHLLGRSFVSTEGPTSRIDSASSSIQSLCAIAILFSHGQRYSRSANQKPSADVKSPISHTGWRQEFLELAMQKWLSSHTFQPSPGTLMLYHMLSLSMYSHFANIGRSAHIAMTRKSSANLPNPKLAWNQVNSDSGKAPSLDNRLEQCFTSEEDQEKAIWHANKILQVARTVKVERNVQPGERMHLMQMARTERDGEPVHYSHAVYYATMVLWCSNDFKHSSTPKNFEHGVQNIAIDNVRQGIALLSRSASFMAGVFKQHLRCLESSASYP